MSTFFTFFSELFQANTGWLADFLLGNIFWLFGFLVLIYFLFDGKKLAAGILLISFDVWLWQDFGVISGIGIFGANVLAFYYLSKIAIVSSITGVAAVLIANLFF